MRSLIALLLVVLVGCLPPLPIDPLPEPNPPPVVPVTGTLWLVVIRETATQTPEQAALLADPWWNAQGSRDVRFRFYDDDQPEAAGYVARAGANRPALLVVDGQGRLGWSGKLPNSVTEIDALVKQAGR